MQQKPKVLLAADKYVHWSVFIKTKKTWLSVLAGSKTRSTSYIVLNLLKLANHETIFLETQTKNFFHPHYINDTFFRYLMKKQFLRSFRVISFINRQAIKKSARLILFFYAYYFFGTIKFFKIKCFYDCFFISLW